MVLKISLPILGTREFPKGSKVGVVTSPQNGSGRLCTQPFSKEDREKMEQAFKDAADAVGVMIAEGADAL